jgi:hypothetical protein
MKHAREDYNRIQDPDGLIPEDEPVFLLRAQDAWAATALRIYATSVAATNPELADLAWRHSMMFDAWPTKKQPDLPGQSLETRAPA